MFEMRRVFISLFKKREPLITHLESNTGGFTFRRDDDYTERVYWQKIERICTYKTDCYSYDMIWLMFERKDKDAIYIREETKGFADFMSAMNKAFSEIDAEWYVTVQMPPFAENFMILYERENHLNETQIQNHEEK